MTGKWNPDFGVNGFLIKVSKDLWIDYIRRKQKIDYTDEIIKKDNRQQTNPQNYDQQKKSDIIETILNVAGEKCKKLFVEIYYFKESMSVISTKLGYSNEHSVKTQHYKCKKKVLAKIQNQKSQLMDLFISE